MRQVIGVLIFAWLSAAGVAAQQNQPSLADIAKEKPKHKAVRVITNDDIPPSPEADSTPTSASGTASASDQGTEDQTASDKKPVPATNVKGDSAEVQAIQKELDTLNQNLAERQARTAEYKQKMDQETDDFRRNTEQQVLAARQAEERRMMQQRDQLEKKLSDAKKQSEKDEKKDSEPSNPPSPAE
jgi:predicted RNase H-like nuclease (RuvC/YqgF family)